MSTVLVTGATGIVGSWLTRALVERGDRVVALVRDVDPMSELVRSGTIQRVTIVNGALEDYAAVERAIDEHDVEVIFHLGAQALVEPARRAPLQTFESNIRGTYHLLEAARRLSPLVRAMVVASSDKAYGKGDSLPYVESMPPLGRHPYDVSKSCADLLAQSYAFTYSTPVAVARCGNIYGGGDLNWSRIVPGTIRSALREEKPVIRSDGTYTRDYIFIDDVVRGYLALAAHVGGGQVAGEAFNFGTESPTTALDLVRLILDRMGASALEPVILGTARAEIKEQFLSAQKAREKLGWTPHYSLGEGLDRTIAWYRETLGQEGQK